MSEFEGVTSENNFLGQWVPETNAEALVYGYWWMMFHSNVHDPSGTVRYVDSTPGLYRRPPQCIPTYEHMCADLKLPVTLSRDDFAGAKAALERALDTILLEAYMLFEPDAEEHPSDEGPPFGLFMRPVRPAAPMRAPGAPVHAPTTPGALSKSTNVVPEAKQAAASSFRFADKDSDAMTVM